MKRTYLILFVILAVVLAVLLGLALQGFARTNLVMPILYAAWLLDLVFRSIPGWVLWGWFLIMALIIAVRSLGGRSTAVQPRRRERIVAEGPVHAWARQVSTLDHGDYFRWHVAHDLAELALHFTAYRDRRGVAKSERVEYIGALDASPEVTAYLEAGLKPPPWQPVSTLARAVQFMRHDREYSPLSLDLVKAVEFLEEQLETDNDA